MTDTAAPFGLRPVRHASGAVRYETAEIASGYATAIGKHSPVKMDANGQLAAAAPGEAFVGVLIGVEYIDPTGKPCRGHWPAGQTLQSGTKAIATITRDPGVIYEIQSDATLAQTAVGNLLDLSADSVSEVTGLSSVSADAATVGTVPAQLQILGFADGPFNAAGDSFPILRVRIAEHQLVTTVTAGV